MGKILATLQSLLNFYLFYVFNVRKMPCIRLNKNHLIVEKSEEVLRDYAYTCVQLIFLGVYIFKGLTPAKPFLIPFTNRDFCKPFFLFLFL